MPTNEAALSNEKQTAGKVLPSDNTPPVRPTTPSPVGSPEASTMESSASMYNDEASMYCEALVQRITDTYDRVTDKEMELVKSLGWG